MELLIYNFLKYTVGLIPIIFISLVITLWIPIDIFGSIIFIIIFERDLLVIEYFFRTELINNILDDLGNIKALWSPITND